MFYFRVHRRIIGTLIGTFSLLALFPLLYKFYAPLLATDVRKSPVSPQPAPDRILKSGNCSGQPVWTRGIHPYFDNRYDDNITAIWTSKDKILSPDVMKWWTGIQSSESVIGAVELTELLEKLLSIIPNTIPYRRRVGDRCRWCAVVGNSGNLRGSKYGKLIDSHDFILRMNIAPTTGFEEDVGSRTTHRFMYPESYIEVTGETKFVMIPFKPLDLRWLISALTNGEIERTYQPVKRKIKVYTNMIEVYNPTLMHRIHKFWNELHGRYPSTGILVLLFAMHVCDQVNVFGFGATSKGNWDHYYNPISSGKEKDSAFKVTGVHNATFEATIIKELEKTGIIAVYRGARI